MTIGFWPAMALGGFGALGSIWGGNKAESIAAQNAQSANFRSNQNILAGRWNTKFGSGMQMWAANQGPRLARQNLGNQKDAARWDTEVLGPLESRGLIDRAERLNIFESSPENTALRKKKKREDFAGRALEANSKLRGLFGNTGEDERMLAELGFYNT